jgi:hypothetical protein
MTDAKPAVSAGFAEATVGHKISSKWFLTSVIAAYLMKGFELRLDNIEPSTIVACRM